MSGIIDDDIKYTMLKGLALQHQFKAVQKMNNDSLTTNQTSSSPHAGKIAGRSVSQIDSTNSKEAQIASRLLH